MSVLTSIGLIVLGFILGVLSISIILVQNISKKRIFLLFPDKLNQYDVILGGIGNRGRLLWKHPKFNKTVKPTDIDLDEWR